MARYKMVICDDAAIIRANLSSLVKNNFPSVQLAGIYADGGEALAHLEREIVDLLIVDIRMERVDGLEVAKYVFEHQLHTKVIIITGYQEFEYAQKAIAYHVNSLITKPIDSAALIKAISEAIADVDAIYDRISDDTQRSFNSYKQISHALRLFVEGGMRLDPLWQDLRSFLQNRKALLLNYYLSPSSKPIPSSTWDDLIPMKTEQFEIYVLSCREKGACCLVVEGEEKAELRQAISRSVDDVIAGIQYFFHGECSAVTLALNDLTPAFSTELFGDFSSFLSSLSELNSDRVQMYADRISFLADTDTLRLMISLMLLFACTEVPSLDIVPFVTELSHTSQCGNAAGLLQKLCKAITAAQISDDAFEDSLRQHIYRNMAGGDLSLEMVAKRFGYSIGHFSRKFRQMTGDTFASYVTELRLERAKELLSDPKSTVASVSAQIGLNTAYFSKLFKKHTGLLPKEYKKHITK